MKRWDLKCGDETSKSGGKRKIGSEVKWSKVKILGGMYYHRLIVTQFVRRSLCNMLSDCYLLCIFLFVVFYLLVLCLFSCFVCFVILCVVCVFCIVVCVVSPHAYSCIFLCTHLLTTATGWNPTTVNKYLLEMWALDTKPFEGLMG